MARRGRPRKVSITLAGSRPVSAPARRAPPPGVRPFDLIEKLLSVNALSWFDAAAARAYVRALSAADAMPIASDPHREKVRRNGDVRGSSAALALAARDLSTQFHSFVVSHIGRDADALLRRALIEGRTFRALAVEAGKPPRSGAERLAQDFRQACSDLARCLALPAGAALVAKLS